MVNPPEIRLLCLQNNERGDLFTRLMKDLFFALGYDDLRLDVHKSGREVDLQGKHRFEPRDVIAECKAHAERIGGEDLNKFFGVLNRERYKRDSDSVAGYFVSLSGFTETAREQEVDTGDDRVILVDGKKVVEELERCRVIVARSDAVECAGRCVQYAGLQQCVLETVELLGHKQGYIWLIFYTQAKERTHFALVAADGVALSQNIAKEIVDADRNCGGILHTLGYLAPAAPAPGRPSLVANASLRYRQWLAEEFGYIHLDGLPADADLSATRLRLERLFVPLKAKFLPRPDDHPDVQQTLADMVESIGEILERVPHLALLAMPGGGKSTLLKRLATAYAFPERSVQVADDLPQRDWLPLVLRCRELRDRAHRPIIELLDDLLLHAGITGIECDAFRESIHARLRDGGALLLIDGLDEIADEGARQAFAKHLRTFLAMFPQTALIVTSREAGFRLVAGVVASACEQARLAALDEDDVLDLCERWHVEVVGDVEKVRSEARDLARTIWSNGRIRPLIENPLLLTTLLVVKRWIGELPRNRTALYREAIRVLVRTWNVEGYVPLDEEETLAQLSYVACSMMEQGKQRVGQTELRKLLQTARRELEAELQFVRISPAEFIERIELRSSLLMQVGFDVIDDLFQPVFEFRHLTFQEYLAARGYIEEQYPGRNAGRHLADLLEPRFQDESWQEIIPLAASLAGRRAEELVQRLTTSCEMFRRTGQYAPRSQSPLALLLSCVLDEVQVTAPTLRAALLELSAQRQVNLQPRWEVAIMRGKFGAIFHQVIEETCLAEGPEFERYLHAWAAISTYQHSLADGFEMSETRANSLLELFEKGNRVKRIRAALICMTLAFSHDQDLRPDIRPMIHALSVCFQTLVDPLEKMLACDDALSAMAASWALAWFGKRRFLQPDAKLVRSLYRVWRHLEPQNRGDLSTWALAEQPLLPRDTFGDDTWGDCDLFLRDAVDRPRIFGGSDQCGALVVGWYRRGPWTDTELAERLAVHAEERPTIDPTVRQLLDSLGDQGRAIIAKIESSRRAKVAAK